MLADGTKFDGPAELRDGAARHGADDSSTTVTEKLLTYALGRGLEYYDMPAVRPIVRAQAGATTTAGRRSILGDRQEHAVPDAMHRRPNRDRRVPAGRSRVMIITKKHLPRRTFLRGLGATLALPLLDGMVPGVSARCASGRRRPARRLGVVYVPNGMRHGQVDAGGRGRRLRADADPRAAGRLPRPAARAERADASDGRCRCRARAPAITRAAGGRS